MKPHLLSSASAIPVEAAEGRVRDRARMIQASVSQHRVPDRIVKANLAHQLDRHVGGDWWAVVMFADRRGASFGRSADTLPPPRWAEEWMAKAAAALNHDLHEGGHWVLAWGKDACPVALWRDGDGDLHTAWEIGFDEGRAPTAETLETLDKAWLLDRGHQALRDTVANLALLQLRPGQQRRAALGEHPLEAARH